MWIADKTTDSSRSHSHKQLPIAERSASFITHCSLCVCVWCIEIVWSFCNITHTHTSSQLWPSIMSVLHCSDCLNRITGSNENWTAVADVYVAAFTTLLSKIQAFLTVCVCVYVCLCGVANGHGNTTHTHTSTNSELWARWLAWRKWTWRETVSLSLSLAYSNSSSHSLTRLQPELLARQTDTTYTHSSKCICLTLTR